MHVQSNGGWLGGWLGGRLGGWLAGRPKTPPGMHEFEFWEKTAPNIIGECRCRSARDGPTRR